MKTADALTGLPARTAFESALEGVVTRCGQAGLPVSAGVVDIDLFGRVNRDYGHATGDGLLKFLSERMLAAFAEPAVCCRFGGDAVAVFWPELEKEQAFLRLEEFRAGFHGSHVVTVDAKAVELQVSVSAGLASFPEDGAKPADILAKAAEALYRAKATGRNKVCLAREEKMVTKTSHYGQSQLMGLRRLAQREGISDAELLREALNDLLRKYNA